MLNLAIQYAFEFIIDIEGNLQDYAEIELEDTEKVSVLFLKGIYTDQNGYYLFTQHNQSRAVTLH